MDPTSPNQPGVPPTDNATVSAFLHQAWRRVQRLLTESRNDANLNREAAAREAAILAHNVRETLAEAGIAWHFQRRDGAVAEELIAAAAEQARVQKSESDVTIMVGDSSHWDHHLAGSVAPGVARHDRLPLLVQP